MILLRSRQRNSSRCDKNGISLLFSGGSFGSDFFFLKIMGGYFVSNSHTTNNSFVGFKRTNIGHFSLKNNEILSCCFSSLFAGPKSSNFKFYRRLYLAALFCSLYSKTKPRFWAGAGKTSRFSFENYKLDFWYISLYFKTDGTYSSVSLYKIPFALLFASHSEAFFSPPL